MSVRQLPERFLESENQSRRDLTKVAQYEVLGYRFKERSVPDGTIDQCRQSLSGVRDRKPILSIVPYGTDVSFCIISQSGSCRILGYFH